MASCAARHRIGVIRLVAVLTTVWLGCFALGAQLVAPVPVAARSAAASVYEAAQQVVAILHDQQIFDEQAATDALRDVPDASLLTALRGKDVVPHLRRATGARRWRTRSSRRRSRRSSTRAPAASPVPASAPAAAPASR
ncbi:hypothetical protein [Pseudonocardia adelaidensis]|uniref:hypothetical protein n=1 Tax=Pseudonocardia adelaidensis TaxID=648754 RepID=UPI0031EB48D1